MTDLITRAREALATYEANYTRREKLAALSPDLARLAIAGAELAEALRHLEGMYDCKDVTQPALAAFNAIAKGNQP